MKVYTCSASAASRARLMARKSIGNGKRSSLITVDEWVVLSQTLPQGSRLLDQMSVVTGLRPKEGGLQQALIPNALRATIAFNLVRMNGQHLDHSKKVAHLASFL